MQMNFSVGLHEIEQFDTFRIRNGNMRDLPDDP